MMKPKSVLFAVAVALCAGCSPKPNAYMIDSGQKYSGRFVIERAAVFSDSLAYNGERAVYIIRDTKSGNEYIGVSGIGVCENGLHQLGKGVAEDER